MDELTQERFAPLDGASYRQLDHWTRRGYLKPEHLKPEEACGSGYRRRWSSDELAVARRMARLVKAGFTPTVAAKVARLGVGCHELADGLFVDVAP